MPRNLCLIRPCLGLTTRIECVGAQDEKGRFPKGSVNDLVVARLQEISELGMEEDDKEKDKPAEKETVAAKDKAAAKQRRFRLALPVAWARLSCDIGRTPGAGVLRIVGAWRPDDAGNRAGAAAFPACVACRLGKTFL